MKVIIYSNNPKNFFFNGRLYILAFSLNSPTMPIRRSLSWKITLIELLVVVAIIGILAAVGTVAYQGYIAGANKTATKSNHASTVKYIAAELAKCSIGESSVMSDNLDCGDAGNTAGAVASAATEALSDFKNSYYSSSDAVIVDTTAGQGQVAISDDGTTVTVTSCVAKGCAGDDVMANEIEIE